MYSQRREGSLQVGGGLRLCQRLREGPVSQGFFLPSPPCLSLSFIHCAELYSEGFRMCQFPTIPSQLSVDPCKCLTPVLHQIPITVKRQTTASEPAQPSQRLTIGLENTSPSLRCAQSTSGVCPVPPPSKYEVLCSLPEPPLISGRSS